MRVSCLGGAVGIRPPWCKSAEGHAPVGNDGRGCKSVSLMLQFAAAGIDWAIDGPFARVTAFPLRLLNCLRGLPWWSQGQGPRGTLTGKARTGLSARLACHMRWSAYGKHSPSHTRGGSRMRESRTYGSVRGARGNSRPYREVCLLHTDCCICSCLVVALGR